MAERGAAPAPRALQARPSGGTGIAPGALRPSRDPFATVMIATPSANAGNARSAEARPRRPKTAARSADGRSVPSPKGRARPPRRAIFWAPIGAPPLDLRGQTPAVPRRGTRDGHPRGRPKAAADFAWLFDIVNRRRGDGARRVRGDARRVDILRRHPGRARKGA